MSGYLRKYVTKYRVIAEYNKATNDYPRMEDGSIDPSFDDLYISCSHGNRIYHYGRNVLVAYIPSIPRGRNIIKSISDPNKIFELEETDKEVLFKFKAENIEMVADLLKAKTGGANIQPFSTRNLPKSKYTIPAEEFALYKEITRHISKEDLLILSRITKAFMNEIASKKLGIKDITADMKLTCLASKEFIHSKGLWNDFLFYLKTNLESFSDKKILYKE